MRHRRIVLIACLLASGLTLGGCETFDATEWFNSKKPLPGDRKAVFPEGVPGVPQGVPPELVQGYQPPPDQPPPQTAEEKPKPKPKPQPRPRQAAAPAAPRASATAPPQQGSQAPWPSAPAQPAPAQSQSPFPDPPRR
ncbi:MAG: hypothetical protein EXQ83_07445 [Xanthobacteraceae bacterium]|nr:hypothetical protein [Xanthobacteraceae bacterium]